MKCDHLRIRNVETLEYTVLHLSGDIAHFLLTDRESKEKDPTVAKVYFTPDGLRKYLEQLLTPSLQVSLDETPDEDADDVLLQDEDEDSEPDEEAGGSSERYSGLEQATYATPRQDYTHEQLLKAVLLWVKIQVAASINDCASRRFMLRAYSPKGGKTLCTISFTGENKTWRPPPPDPEAVAQATTSPASAQASPGAPQSPRPDPTCALPGLTAQGQPLPPHLFPPPPGMLIFPASYHDGTLFGTAGAFRALSESYQDLSKLLIGGVSQIQSMNGELINRMGNELQSSRSQVDQLVDDILDHRIKAVEVQGQLQESASQADQRMLLAREALAQLGEGIRTFAQSRGLSAELSGVLGRISAHSGLMSALTDPGVQELMQSEENLEALAVLLREVARQQGARGGAGSQASPDASGPQSLPQGSQPYRALPGTASQAVGQPMMGGYLGGMPQPLAGGFTPQPGYPGQSGWQGYPGQVGGLPQDYPSHAGGMVPGYPVQPVGVPQGYPPPHLQPGPYPGGQLGFPGNPGAATTPSPPASQPPQQVPSPRTQAPASAGQPTPAGPPLAPPPDPRSSPTSAAPRPSGSGTSPAPGTQAPGPFSPGVTRPG